LKKLLALFGLFYILNAYSVDSYWLTLLHYKKNFLGGYESLIDDKNFFVAKNGKYSPNDELLASIKLIKTNPSKFACRFPLRYKYLNSKYKLSDFNLTSCADLQKYLDDITPNRAVLVFADADMNKPASMFGHTFIRIDTKENLPVLSSAVNYAARVTDTNGVLFAFKGVFGFYEAYYSLLPYYDKLKQYSDKDNRDLWEYGLKLNKRQVVNMALHIWELKEIYSDYYFFSENCSYNILFLIEAADPNLHITDDYFLTVIPLDTVKDLKKKGMITSFTYRPSLVTQIETISKPVKNKELIVNIAYGKTDPYDVLAMNISEEQKARILDSAVRYLEYLSKKISIDKNIYTKRFITILRARSKVNYISNYKYKTPFNPVNSHNSKRLTVAVGNEDKNYALIGLRLAYHTLDDPIKGYKLGSSLAFGDFRAVYEDKKLKIDKIGLIEIESLTKRDVFFHPVSWKVFAGFYKKRIKNGNKLVFEINPGGGFTYEFKKTLFYIMAESDVNINKNYEDGYALGLGLQIGAVKYYNNNAFLFTLGADRYFAGDEHTKRYLNVDYRYTINNQNAFKISYGFLDEYEKSRKIEAYFYHYF